jgi:predicted nucleic acid-binding protein
VIVLDTNIVSVLLSPAHPDLAAVEAWREASGDQDFRLAAVTRAEIAYGVAVLPDGARKRALAAAARQFLSAAEPVTLPFGAREADAYGQIVAARRAAGRPIGVLDAQIAAVARVAGAAVATRDVAGFLDCGVAVVNPYDAAPGGTGEGGSATG